VSEKEIIDLSKDTLKKSRSNIINRDKEKAAEELEVLEKKLEKLRLRLDSGDTRVLGEWFKINDRVGELRDLLEEEPPKRSVGRPIEYPDSKRHRQWREAQRRWYKRHREEILAGTYEPTGKRKVYCPDCGEAFDSRDQLDNHMRAVHGKKHRVM
jgi:hypothetical protein